MANYKLISDSGCDISLDKFEAWDVECIDLRFSFTDEEVEYHDHDMDVKVFYDHLRDGRVAKTAALNTTMIMDRLRPFLEQGQDVFYLVFSSGLSSTYSSAVTAVEELSEEFPDRKIIAVDSLSESSGQGLLLYLTKNKRDEGATIEELKAYVEDTRLSIAHFFTVDDLVYLKRGGRLSATKAAVGSMLNLKPLLHVDDEGHLIGYQNVRGRKTSIEKLAQAYKSKSTDFTNGPYIVSHGDCEKDALALVGKVKELGGPEPIFIDRIGPVIGAHVGPSILTIFFVGDNRQP